MDSLPRLLDALGQANKVYWQGGVGDEAIIRLQELLRVRLPSSFCSFLRECGGGGVIGAEISGIEGGNPSIDNRGTIVGDTFRCRDDFGLPAQFVVVYYGDDDVVWCLDTASFADDECRVVSFDAMTKVVYPLWPSFAAFLEDYVTARVKQSP